MARQLLCRAGLADAGLAGEHDDAPVPRAGLLECAPQHLQLALPPDESVGRRGDKGLRTAGPRDRRRLRAGVDAGTWPAIGMR